MESEVEKIPQKLEQNTEEGENRKGSLEGLTFE